MAATTKQKVLIASAIAVIGGSAIVIGNQVATSSPTSIGAIETNALSAMIPIADTPQFFKLIVFANEKDMWADYRIRTGFQGPLMFTATVTPTIAGLKDNVGVIMVSYPYVSIANWVYIISSAMVNYSLLNTAMPESEWAHTISYRTAVGVSELYNRVLKNHPELLAN